MVVMGGALFASYPLSLLGWEVAAGVAFVIAMQQLCTHPQQQDAAHDLQV